MTSRIRQKGAVLVVSLLLLVVLTMLALASVSTSNVNLLIVGNLQSQQETEALAQRAIEDTISSSASFTNPAAATTTPGNDYTVVVAEPTCLGAREAAGYSATWGLTPEDTTWEIIATATNSDTGSRAVIHQGVEIQMTAGGC